MSTVQTSFKKGSSGFKALDLAQTQGWKIDVIATPTARNANMLNLDVCAHRVAVIAVAEDVVSPESVIASSGTVKVVAIFDDAGRFLTSRKSYYYGNDGRVMDRGVEQFKLLMNALSFGPEGRRLAKIADDERAILEGSRQAVAREALGAAAETQEIKRLLQWAVNELAEAEHQVRLNIKLIQGRLDGASEALDEGRRSFGSFGTISGQFALEMAAAQARWNAARETLDRLEFLFGTPSA